MASTFLPPDGSTIGTNTQMRLVFSYVPVTGPKDIEIKFSCDPPNAVTFDPPETATDDDGVGAVLVTNPSQTAGEQITINVHDSAMTLLGTATYTTRHVRVGALLMYPSAVPTAPDEPDMNKDPYTSTVEVSVMDAATRAPLKDYPVAFPNTGNFRLFDMKGNPLKDDNGVFYFNMTSLGQPVTFKIASLYDGIVHCNAGYGTGFTVSPGTITFTPELVGGPLPSFDISPPLDLDDYPGSFYWATISGGKIPPNLKETQDVIALVNGNAASEVVKCATLLSGVPIQKSAFGNGSIGDTYQINWMTTDPDILNTQQSLVVQTEVTGMVNNGPPQDGTLPQPYFLGISIINKQVVLLNKLSLYVPQLTKGEKITIVYYLNGWDKNGEPKTDTHIVLATAAADGTNQFPIDTSFMGGYYAYNNAPGNYQCYYYQGDTVPGDKTTYSAPQAVIPLVTD
jgi:hypothetical protein